MRNSLFFFFLTALLLAVVCPALGYVPAPSIHPPVYDVAAISQVYETDPVFKPLGEVYTPSLFEWSSGRYFTGSFGSVKVHVPADEVVWIVCQSNPVNYTDPTGMFTWKSFGEGLLEPFALLGDIIVSAEIAAYNLFSDYDIAVEDVRFSSKTAQAQQALLASGASRSGVAIDSAASVTANVFTAGGYSYYQLCDAYMSGQITIDQLDESLSFIAGCQVTEATLALAAKPGKSGISNQEFIQQIAIRAEGRIGGSGRLPGIFKHTYADKLLMRYQRRFGSRGLSTEVPYLMGQAGLRGKGSIRLDVVEGPLNNPTMIFDYKFGRSGLTSRRINQIRAVGQFNESVPIIEVRP